MRNRNLILFSLLVAAFAINVDTTIVNVALPTLVRELHATNTQLQWIVDAYNLMFAALLLASGSLSDRVGRKGVLLAGLGVFGTASVAGGLTSDPDQLVMARCFMGLGAAMVFPATLSLLSNVFTERTDRARAIGLWAATNGMAIALGPIAGGALLESHSWTSIFLVMAPVAAIAAALVAWSVPASRDPDAAGADRPGLILSSAAMALLIYTIIEAPNHGWSGARTLLGFTLAVALFGAFVTWERRAEGPMLDVTLFRNARFTAASGSVTIAFFALFGFIFLITQYFQFFKHYGPLSAGVHLLPVASSVGVASVLGTKLAMRFGTKFVVASGLLMVACFYAWVATSDAALSYNVIAAQMVLFGIGTGFTTAPATESIMDAVPTTKAGVGSAVNDATRLLGGTLGVAIIGSVYASLYNSRLTTALPAGLPHGLANVAHNSVGAALTIAGQLSRDGHAALAAGVQHAASAAFFHGFSAGNLVASGVAAAGAIMAAALLPSHPQGRRDDASPARALPTSAPASSRS